MREEGVTINVNETTYQLDWADLIGKSSIVLTSRVNKKKNEQFSTE